VSTRTDTPARSKEHHVAVGLGFWSAFKRGDMDECVELLHPDVEWHPSPRLDELDAVRGREDVRITLEALHDRFADDLEVLPEDGRQIGDHVLMVTMLRGSNAFTRQPIKSRECWVVSIRDDKLGRIVNYPNAPAARLGFEELLRASELEPPMPDVDPEESAMDAETNPSDGALRAVTLASEMENSAATSAELANVDSPAADIGPMPSPVSGSITHITLSFSFEEAEALNRWLLKPSQDGGLAADDATVRPGFMKIRTAVEHAQAIAAVRHELEQAGVPTQHLSDQQVAQLGRRISQAAPRLGGAQG
jgi:ketosteroid isomerase-like protein